MTSTPDPIDLAFALLREGRLVEAEALMARELRAATATHGEGSPAWALERLDGVVQSAQAEFRRGITERHHAG